MNNLTIQEILNSLQQKKFSSAELTRYYLKKSREDLDKGDSGVRPFITLLDDMAIARAEEADKRISQGETAPLLGVPLAIKDNINIEGAETTCASQILKGYISPYDAYVIKKLKDAGAVFTAKTNMDEFAMGSSNETSSYWSTRNPHDLSRIPGGSSGGSAAAVSGDFVSGAIGSDTGGSIRLPAGLCGIVGVKPTYGRVSRFGLVAYGSSLDQIGPLTKTVEDAALMLSVLSGYDKMDSTSIDVPIDNYSQGLRNSIKGKKIGVPKEYFIEGLDDDVKKTILKAIDMLKSQGCEIVDISLPRTGYAVPVYYIIATSEASSNLARFDGIRYGKRVKDEDITELFMKTRDAGFGDEVKRRIMIGTYSLSSGYYDAYYLQALKARTIIKNDFLNAFEKVDAIISPVSPTTAFKIGEKINDPIKMYLSDIFTISANLAGIPGISLPIEKNAQGLPVGVQLMGKHFDEKTMLNLAFKLEEAAGYDFKI